MQDYWRTQTPDKPLFPDIAWSKPEQAHARGKLGIIGGNKLGFTSVADNYSFALGEGVGKVRVLLPQSLKRTIPTTITDASFSPDTTSGGLSGEALPDLKAFGDWADAILLVGDAGKNSETAILYESFVASYQGKLAITRDAIDLLMSSAPTLLERPETLIVASFSQLQKLFQTVYYPKVLRFNMQLAQFAETLHKFTTSYPVSIIVPHAEHLVISHNGEVVSQPIGNVMKIWKGHTATQAVGHWLWSPNKPFEAFVASVAE
jgi:NAD(P)H-hydrate repair Nnr-like enzyme with NAD(P)H-hydrate dehydratase domain